MSTIEVILPSELQGEFHYHTQHYTKATTVLSHLQTTISVKIIFTMLQQHSHGILVIHN
jgi:hypothetical protein